MSATTSYYKMNSGVDGWTFAGDSQLAVNANNRSQLGFLVNEGPLPMVPSNGAVGALSLSGLTPGVQCTVNFTLSGDNIPGEAWVFHLAALGGTIMTVNGIDGWPGTNPGVCVAHHFAPSTSLETLYFCQAFQTLASPIVTNIRVSVLPPNRQLGQ